MPFSACSDSWLISCLWMSRSCLHLLRMPHDRNSSYAFQSSARILPFLEWLLGQASPMAIPEMRPKPNGVYEIWFQETEHGEVTQERTWRQKCLPRKLRRSFFVFLFVNNMFYLLLCQMLENSHRSNCRTQMCPLEYFNTHVHMYIYNYVFY